MGKEFYKKLKILQRSEVEKILQIFIKHENKISMTMRIKFYHKRKNILLQHRKKYPT